MNTKILSYKDMTDYSGRFYVFTTLSEDQAKKFLSADGAEIKPPEGLIAMMSLMSESNSAYLKKTLSIDVKTEILFESLKEYKWSATEAIKIKSLGLKSLMNYLDLTGEHGVIITEALSKDGRTIYVSDSLKEHYTYNH